MKSLFLIVGLLAFLVGLFWIGQGLNYIQWPSSSLMVNQNKWAVYGGVLAIVGLLIMIWFARR